MNEIISISSSITPPSPTFLISDNAAARIVFLLESEPKGSALRIAVDGGGCSGFQYRFEFDATPATDDDLIFSHHDATVIIDSVSLGFLERSMIDYVENLGASYFEIKNPNSTSSCGCGNSFAV
jgi:iron-sulfur cluster insertion protein